MDPNATMLRILASNDLQEARDLMSEYLDWVWKGGFKADMILKLRAKEHMQALGKLTP
jgi:hypothetical protein